MIQCLRVEGVTDIIGIAKYEFQAERAKKLGPLKRSYCIPVLIQYRKMMKLTASWGVDQVYECVGGETDALDQSVHMCRMGGQVVMLRGSIFWTPAD